MLPAPERSVSEPSASQDPTPVPQVADEPKPSRGRHVEFGAVTAFGAALLAIVHAIRPLPFSSTDDAILHQGPIIKLQTDAALEGSLPRMFWELGSGWTPFESGQAGVFYPLYHFANIVSRLLGRPLALLDVSAAIHLWLAGAICVGLLPRTMSRNERMRAFFDELGVTNETRILDIGGTAFNWSLLPIKPRVTVVNVVPRPADLPDYIVDWIEADARKLPFADKEFDIAFSNSVIEHVGDWESQVAFANEVHRVAPRHWVQTPNYWFPVEPHYLGLFTHWLPREAQERFAIRYASVRGLMTRPSDEQIRQMVAELRLLREDEVRRLFPKSKILKETVGGLVKSFTAVGSG